MQRFDELVTDLRLSPQIAAPMTFISTRTTSPKTVSSTSAGVSDQQRIVELDEWFVRNLRSQRSSIEI